jgi:hypothetical protein
MLNWIKQLLRKESVELRQRREIEARSYLADLRANELSVGAAMRRGEPVSKAPGQTGNSKAVDHRQQVARPKLAARSSGGTKAGTGQNDSRQEDVATSLNVGMATGSASAGYVAGGSALGGVVGETIAQQLNDDRSN